jgi:thiaminase
MFAGHAAAVIAEERKLHGSLLADLGIDPASADAAEPAPTTLAYTSYLLATVRGGSYAEGVGAVLPCYWIYWEVGKELLQRGSPNPRYQQWIDTYGGEEFGDVVREVLAVADGLPSGGLAGLAWRAWQRPDRGSRDGSDRAGPGAGRRNTRRRRDRHRRRPGAR